ncbi:MAG: caspase family protein [Pseudomonadota bacterium]
MKRFFVFFLLFCAIPERPAFGDCASQSELRPSPASGADGDPVEIQALVMGVSKYPEGIRPIPHAAKDIDLISDALLDAGLSDRHIKRYKDPTYDEMYDAAEDFACGINPGDFAIVYYSGHGIQVGIQNYLLGSDTRLSSADCPQCDSVPVEHILQLLANRRPSAVVLLLDACRTDPFRARLETIVWDFDNTAPGRFRRASFTRPALIQTVESGLSNRAKGLTPIEIRDRLPAMYVFAAHPGRASLFKPGDEDRGSVFTRILSEEFISSDLSIQEISTNAASKVEEETLFEQIPYVDWGTLRSKIFIKENELNSVTRDGEWDSVINSGDSIETLIVRMFRFMRKHPASPYEYYIRSFISANRHRLSPDSRTLVAHVTYERLARNQQTVIGELLLSDKEAGEFSDEMERELLEERVQRQLRNEAPAGSLSYELSWSEGELSESIFEQIIRLSQSSDRLELYLEIDLDPQRGAVFDERLNNFLAITRAGGVSGQEVRTYVLPNNGGDDVQEIRVLGFQTEDISIPISACSNCPGGNIRAVVSGLFSRPSPSQEEILRAEIVAQSPIVALGAARTRVLEARNGNDRRVVLATPTE